MACALRGRRRAAEWGAGGSLGGAWEGDHGDVPEWGGVPVWGETGTCGEIVCGGVPEQGRFLRERAYG